MLDALEQQQRDSALQVKPPRLLILSEEKNFIRCRQALLKLSYVVIFLFVLFEKKIQAEVTNLAGETAGVVCGRMRALEQNICRFQVRV